MWYFLYINVGNHFWPYHIKNWYKQAYGVPAVAASRISTGCEVQVERRNRMLDEQEAAAVITASELTLQPEVFRGWTHQQLWQQ